MKKIKKEKNGKTEKSKDGNTKKSKTKIAISLYENYSFIDHKVLQRMPYTSTLKDCQLTYPVRSTAV